MSDRKQVSADMLIGAVNAGTHRVTIALIHPEDMATFPSEKMEALRSTLKLAGLLPSAKVERGWLYVDTQVLRR